MVYNSQKNFGGIGTPKRHFYFDRVKFSTKIFSKKGGDLVLCEIFSRDKKEVILSFFSFLFFSGSHIITFDS